MRDYKKRFKNIHKLKCVIGRKSKKQLGCEQWKPANLPDAHILYPEFMFCDTCYHSEV